MNTTSKSGNDPQKYGPSRWASPKFYYCEHNGYNGCEKAATRYYRKVDFAEQTVTRSHNCCGTHESEIVND